MDSPNLLTRSCQLLLQLPIRSARDLNLLRKALLDLHAVDFVRARVTSAVLACGTFRDRHFAVAEEDYRAIVGLAHML